MRKSERGTTGYFFKRLELRDGTKADADEDAVRRIPLLRAFTLFHASQIEGVPAYVPPTVAEAPWRAPAAAELILANSGAVVRTGGDRAFYSPSTDHIQMPPPAAFATAATYCGVLLHEACHWTGHPSRLNRDLRTHFGSHDYAREELRAEIGQVMACTELGIVDCDFTNNAAYIATWLEKLRADRKEIFRAAADAQRIANYLLAFHPDYAAGEGSPPERAPLVDNKALAGQTPPAECSPGSPTHRPIPGLGGRTAGQEWEDQETAMNSAGQKTAAAPPSAAARVRRALRSRAAHALAPALRDAARGRGLPEQQGG